MDAANLVSRSNVRAHSVAALPVQSRFLAKAEGEIFYDDEDILRYSDAQLAKFRRKNIGFVFQFFNLVPELTAKENIFLPMMIDKVKVDEGTIR